MGRNPRRRRLGSVNSDPALPGNPEDLLTPARAAAIAERSVRTIRRAYSSGRLIAFRDGGGRGVRISYGDLRRWLLCEEIRSPATPPRQPVPPSSPGSPPAKPPHSDNLALIRAAREHQRRAAQQR
jgi:hypothetical protein